MYLCRSYLRRTGILGFSSCKRSNQYCRDAGTLLTIFQPPAGMSPTKLSLAENILIIPGQGEFGKWHPGWGKSLTFFTVYWVRSMFVLHLRISPPPLYKPIKLSSNQPEGCSSYRHLHISLYTLYPQAEGCTLAPYTFVPDWPDLFLLVPCQYSHIYKFLYTVHTVLYW